MSWLSAIFLALIAGVTEILPVSGTGHLYLFEKILGLSSSSADLRAFRGMLYLGAAMALILYYRGAVLAMLREFFVVIGASRPVRRQRGVPFFRRLQFLMLIASVPMLAGLFLTGLLDRIDRGDYTLIFVSVFLFLNGALLFFAGSSAKGKRDLTQATLSDALCLGAAQILSVFPGLSRSGLTLSAGLTRGMDGGSAMELSGLMGIPVFLFSGIRQLIVTGGAERTLSVWLMLAGFFMTAAVGLVTLRIVSDKLSHRRPTGFAFWSWGAGILSFIVFLLSA